MLSALVVRPLVGSQAGAAMPLTFVAAGVFGRVLVSLRAMSSISNIRPNLATFGGSFGSVTCSVTRLMALAADSFTTGIQIGVEFIVGVTLRAMRFVSVQGSDVGGATQVLSQRDDFQMVGANTESCLAQVVNCEAIWDRPKRLLISPPVSHLSFLGLPIGLAVGKSAIAVRGHIAAGPQPTSVGLFDLTPKQNGWGMHKARLSHSPDVTTRQEGRQGF